MLFLYLLFEINILKDSCAFFTTYIIHKDTQILYTCTNVCMHVRVGRKYLFAATCPRLTDYN